MSQIKPTARARDAQSKARLLGRPLYSRSFEELWEFLSQYKLYIIENLEENREGAQVLLSNQMEGVVARAGPGPEQSANMPWL